MAGNGAPGKGRKGAVAKRTQFKNGKTGLWSKRKKPSGKIMDTKTSGGKFKGVRKEK